MLRGPVLALVSLVALPWSLSREEIKQEFAKQLRIMDREAPRSIDARLKAKDLSPDVREFMAEGLAELRANSHSSKTP